ncbi:hypothetical protein BT69DRAFT_1277614 [Atractiella rhizophila]|nr:hypothetical protein BT69DRAFT_1277614 [Atractiella rhizophila]
MKVRVISGVGEAGSMDKNATFALVRRARAPSTWAKTHEYDDPPPEGDSTLPSFRYNVNPPAKADFSEWLITHPLPPTPPRLPSFEHKHSVVVVPQKRTVREWTLQEPAVVELPPVKDRNLDAENEQARGSGKLASIIPAPYFYPVVPVELSHSPLRDLPQAPILHTLLTPSELYNNPLRKRLGEHHRGFWLIPVYLPPPLNRLPVSRASIPTWPRVLSSRGDSQNSNQTKSTNLSVPNQFSNLEWTNRRLYGFHRMMCKVANTGRMGHIVIQAFFAPSSAPSPLEPDSSLHSQESYTTREQKQQAIRNWGDHLRVWCDGPVALAVREAMKEITNKPDDSERCIGDGIALIWCDEKGRPMFVA